MKKISLKRKTYLWALATALAHAGLILSAIFTYIFALRNISPYQLISFGIFLLLLLIWFISRIKLYEHLEELRKEIEGNTR